MLLILPTSDAAGIFCGFTRIVSSVGPTGSRLIGQLQSLFSRNVCDYIEKLLEVQ